MHGLWSYTAISFHSTGVTKSVAVTEELLIWSTPVRRKSARGYSVLYYWTSLSGCVSLIDSGEIPVPSHFLLQFGIPKACEVKGNAIEFCVERRSLQPSVALWQKGSPPAMVKGLLFKRRSENVYKKQCLAKQLLSETIQWYHSKSNVKLTKKFQMFL